MILLLQLDACTILLYVVTCMCVVPSDGLRTPESNLNAQTFSCLARRNSNYMLFLLHDQARFLLMSEKFCAGMNHSELAIMQSRD